MDRRSHRSVISALMVVRALEAAPLDLALSSMTTKSGLEGVQVSTVTNFLPIDGIHYLSAKNQIQWLTEPSDLGCTKSQHRLGRLYLDGERSLENLSQAYKWLFIAVALGNKNAEKDLIEVNTLMSHDDIDDAYELALSWIEALWDAPLDRDESKWYPELLQYRFTKSAVN
jgi:TPR repeat protein